MLSVVQDVETLDIARARGRARPAPGAETGEDTDHLKAIIRTQAEVLATDLEPAPLTSLVVQRTAELTRADGAMAELLDGGELVVQAAAGAARTWSGARRPAPASLAQRVSGPPEAKLDRELLERLKCESAAPRRLDVRSMMTLPLACGGRAIGLLSVFTTTPRTFDDRDETTAAAMAELIAASWSRAARHESMLHDPLTRLATRALFEDRLVLSLARARRRPSVTVLMVDVDDFARINATLGPAAGDELLAQVAERLREACRPSDTVARWEGDQFAILTDDVVGAAEAQQLAGRIARAMSRPFLVGGICVPMTASIGVAQAHDPYADPRRILEVADGSMNRMRMRRRSGLRGSESAGEPN